MYKLSNYVHAAKLCTRWTAFACHISVWLKELNDGDTSNYWWPRQLVSKITLTVEEKSTDR